MKRKDEIRAILRRVFGALEFTNASTLIKLEALMAKREEQAAQAKTPTPIPDAACLPKQHRVINISAMLRRYIVANPSGLQ